MVNTLKKAFAMFAIVAVAVMGLPFHSAKAATLSAGDLIKASGPAVYYYAADGKRYVFPNEKTYRTWYKDFSTVKTITDAELASIQIGGNIVYRPGTRLAKITTDPKVYAVGPNGTLHWITSESLAKQLYGNNWADLVDDIPDAFFTNYTYGSDITTAVHPDGTLIKYAGSSDIYVIENGQKRLIVDQAAFDANNFNEAYVLTISDSVTYPDGPNVTGAEPQFTDTAQLNSDNSDDNNVTTDLRVEVASTSPASQTLPLGAVGVEVAQFTFTAGSGDVNIDGLVLTRAGLGNANEIEKVYLYKDGVKLTSGRTINSSTHTVTFTNLGLTVPANSSITLAVKVDTSAVNGGGEHYFEIAGVGDVTADANVGGVFPVAANTFYVSNSVNVGKADVESNNTTYTYKVGETDVELANFTVYVDNTENGQLESITLYNAGRDIISNLKLYRGSTLLATGVQNGDYWTFDLSSPYEIAKGDSAQFTVKGDVSGRDGDSATLYVRYRTDVIVKGMTYGYALNIDGSEGTGNNSYVDEAATLAGGTRQENTVNVEAGQLTVAFNGPVSTDVAKNSNDVTLMNFALTAQSNVDVEKATINISGNANLVQSDIENLELVCNDVVVANWATVTIGDNISTDVWSIPAGGVNCEVRVDITNSAAGDETILATLKDLSSTTYWVFKDTNTGDTITDIVPSGDVAGNTMTITSASLTINVASSPATGNVYVPRTADADVVAFLFTAGNAADVKVTNIKLKGAVDDNRNSTYNEAGENVKDVVSAVKLYDEDGNQIGTTESLVDDGTGNYYATFDNLSLEIPAGQTIKVLAKVDVASTAPLSSDDDYISLRLTNVTAEYGNNGSALAANIANGNDTYSVYQTLTSAGELTASLYADTPLNSLVAMNSEVLATQVKFSATREDIRVEKFEVALDPNQVTNRDEFASVRVEYTNSAGNTESKTAYFVDGVADFSDLDVLVPEDDSTVVNIYVTVNDEYSADNYDNATAGSENGFAAIQLTTNNFRSVTMVSGEVNTTLASAITGNNMYVFNAYPEFAVDTNGGSLVSSSAMEIGTIYVSAKGNKDVIFDNDGGGNYGQLVVHIYGTGASSTADWSIKDDNSNVLCSGTTAAVPNDTAITCQFDTNSLTVAKGTTKALHVYLDTTTAGLGDAANESVSIALEEGEAAIQWRIDGDTTIYGDVSGTEITDILVRGNLVGGTYSN